MSIREDIQGILDTAITVNNNCEVIPKVDQIITDLKAEIEKIENPFEGYIDVVENIRFAKSYGFEKLKQDILKLLEE